MLFKTSKSAIHTTIGFFIVLIIITIAAVARETAPRFRSFQHLFEVEAAGTLSTDPNLKVAFIGDQGVSSDSEAVLQLIKNEGAHAVVHGGDYDYKNDPAQFDALVEGVLQSTIPYFGSVGNHDDQNWTTPNGGYQAVLERRSGSFCTGQKGVRASCNFKGLHILELGYGTMGDDADQVNFIQTEFAQSNSIWRICSWHKTEEALQVGGKTGGVGYEGYEECRKAGAIIVTGHEHSYHRTKTLTSMTNQTIDPTCSSPTQLCVGPNRSFVAVSGIAGKSIRVQQRCFPSTFPYGCNGVWASIYTSDQGANHGALFITFNYQGDPNKAHGYFKNIDGQVIDEFDITTEGGTTGGCPRKPEGDADCNGLIQLNDFETWRKEYLGTVGTTDADFDGIGGATLADFQIWRTGYFAQTVSLLKSKLNFLSGTIQTQKHII